MANLGADVRLQFIVTLQSALHVGTGLGLAQMLDDRTVQGPHPLAHGQQDADVPYIPGSSLKGRLRFHVRTLSTALAFVRQEQIATETRLFGSASIPCNLIFSDAHLAPGPVSPQSLAAQGGKLLPLLTRSERSFVSLSRERRVAVPQRLFRIELADTELVFASQIYGTLPPLTVRRDLALLVAALRDLTHLGGHKGRGLGACQLTIGAINIDHQPVAWQTLLETLR